MAELNQVLSQEEIEQIISALARRISSDYKGKDLVCIGILKGAFVFMADLVRRLTVPVTIEFLRASSYGSGTTSSGNPELDGTLTGEIRGRELLLVEDIVDTGLTLQRIVAHLKSMGPNSVKVCALIDKRERREVQMPVDYAGYVTDSGFLVGFGLDYAENYRNLPGIFELNF
jgi:hypoxanthine phosphoribosyltransferase